MPEGLPKISVMPVNNRTQPDTSGRRQSQKKNSNESDLLTTIQKWVLYAVLFMTPTFFFPTPWGGAEHSRGVLFIVGALILAGIELMKIFNGDKFSIFRGILDGAAVAVLGSFVVSTIFSFDNSMSLWGYDDRLGTGLVAVIAMYVISIVMRGLIKNIENVASIMRTFVWGMASASVISLVGMLGYNVIGGLLGLSAIYPAAYPVMGLPFVSMLAWGVALMVLVGLVALGTEKKYKIVNVVSAVLLVIGLVIYGSVQGLAIMILLVLGLAIVGLMAFMNKDSAFKEARMWAIVIATVVLVGSVVTRVPAINEQISGSMDVVQQVPLSGQVTWEVVVQSLSSSASRGFLGSGVDTFAVYYNQNRPAVSGGIDLSTITYAYGNNEFMTLIGNRGLIGGMIWLLVGGLLGYVVYGNWKKTTGGTTSVGFGLNVVGLAVVILYAASFVTFYTSVLYFIFFVLLGILVSVNGALSPRDTGKVSIQLDMLVEQIGAQRNNAVAVVLTVIILSVTTLGLYGIGRNMTAAVYAARAENTLAEMRIKVNEGEDISIDQQRETANEAVQDYTKGLALQSNNAYLYRTTASLIIQYVDSVIAEIQQDDNPQTAYEEQADLVDANITNAIELASEATDIAPLVYANWDTRAFVYTKVVSYGFTAYYEDAVSTLTSAVILNPSNPAIYYNIALMHQVEGENEKALAATQESLRLRVDLEPILLAGQLSADLGNLDDSKAYFEAALELLEALDAKESDLYTAVENRIKEINNASATGDIESVKDGGEVIDEELQDGEEISVPQEEAEVVEDDLEEIVGEEEDEEQTGFN